MTDGECINPVPVFLLPGGQCGFTELEVHGGGAETPVKVML